MRRGERVWDPRSKPEKRVEHPNCPNHLADAALYAWRKAYHYLAEAQSPPPPVPLTNEWFRAEEQRMREAAEAEVESRKVGLEDPAEWDERFLH